MDTWGKAICLVCASLEVSAVLNLGQICINVLGEKKMKSLLTPKTKGGCVADSLQDQIRLFAYSCPCSSEYCFFNLSFL